MQENNFGEPKHEWPSSLDAVIAAPEYHEVILENENVRVLDTRVKPGERVPTHTHRWPSVVYTLNSGDSVSYDADGNAVVDSRIAPLDLKPGDVVWLSSLQPHSIENVGDTEMRAISIELKHLG